MLDKKIKKQLSALLWLERGAKMHNIIHVSKTLHINPVSLDYIEQGLKDSNWKMYERLLDFYAKDIEIRLVDKNIN